MVRHEVGKRACIPRAVSQVKHEVGKRAESLGQQLNGKLRKTVDGRAFVEPGDNTKAFLLPFTAPSGDTKKNGQEGQLKVLLREIGLRGSCRPTDETLLTTASMFAAVTPGD